MESQLSAKGGKRPRVLGMSWADGPAFRVLCEGRVSSQPALGNRTRRGCRTEPALSNRTKGGRRTEPALSNRTKGGCRRAIQNENPRPFGFPLGCARGFGKTGQAGLSKNRRDKGRGARVGSVTARLKAVPVPLRFARARRSRLHQFAGEVARDHTDNFGIGQPRAAVALRGLCHRGEPQLFHHHL